MKRHCGLAGCREVAGTQVCRQECFVRRTGNQGREEGV